MKNILNYHAEGYKQFKLYKFRLKNVDLKWVDQVLEIVQLFKIKKINDLGCNYFQFYKGLKKNKKIKYDYFGYDFEEKFLNLGLKEYPELSKKFKIGDIKKTKLRKCDCSIASAIIEHVSNPYKLIKKICLSSKKILILRTFLGENDEFILKKNAKNPYYFNQFSINKIKKTLKSYGFETMFILDEATNFSNKYKMINKKSRRKMFIVLGYKKI